MTCSPPIPPDKPAVAIIGVGVVGGAITTRLLAEGYGVTVFDVDVERLGAAVAHGAQAATSPADATRRAAFVILSLTSAPIVETVVFGANGVATAGTAKPLLLDMSSIDPEATKAFARRLFDQCGMTWLDAPLSGGAPGALAGRLTVMAGGEAADFARAKAVMVALASNFTHMGPVGAGQTTKLVNQVLVAGALQALAEAIALAERNGVTATLLPQALAGGRADSRLLQEFGAKMAVRDYELTGTIGTMVKDLAGVTALAEASHLALPMIGGICDIFQTLKAAGHGNDDIAALMRQFD